MFPAISGATIKTRVFMQRHEYQRKKITVPDEIRLRQLTVDEALFLLDQYLHDAFMSGLYQVRVVHGKGTGTLRQVIQRCWQNIRW